MLESGKIGTVITNLSLLLYSTCLSLYSTNGTITFLSFGYRSPNLSLYHRWPLYARGSIRRISERRKMYGGDRLGANREGGAERKEETDDHENAEKESWDADMEGKGAAAKANPNHSNHSQR